MTEGYIKLYRSLFDNDIWFLEPFTKAQAWIDLIGNTNHKDNEINIRGNMVKIERGQIGWSELTMAKRWTWSRDKVRRFLKWLETRQQIKQQKTNLTTVITILNYELYQSDKQTIRQQKRQQTIQQKDSKKTADDTQLINDKNEKNEKNNINNIALTSIQKSEPKSKIIFNFENEKWEGITDKDLELWSKAYPAAILKIEFAKMKAWILKAGAKGHKSNWGMFIIRWLTKCQDNGGTKT